MSRQDDRRQKAGVFEDRGMIAVTCSDGSVAGVFEQCDSLPWIDDRRDSETCPFRISSSDFVRMARALREDERAASPTSQRRVTAEEVLEESAQCMKGHVYVIASAMDALTMGGYPRLSIVPGSMEAELELERIGLGGLQKAYLEGCVLTGPIRVEGVMEMTGLSVQEVRTDFDQLCAKGYMVSKPDGSFFCTHDGFLAVAETKRLLPKYLDRFGFGDAWSDIAESLGIADPEES